MPDATTIVTAALGLYALGTTVFLILENRRPQATLAWMLVFFFAPGFGLLIYVLFGREHKAFSKQKQLVRQDLEANLSLLLAPVLSRQDAMIARLERESVIRRKLMRLVRANPYSALTTRNRVDLQQDARRFYPSLLRDLSTARHSIHLQYFTWAVDAFTERLKDLLKVKAGEGVEVRVLYGSPARLSRSYVRDMQAAGIQMVPTSPLHRLHMISYRNHRKITVIDGVIGYTGGMNIGQEHLDGGPGFDSWRDTQVRIVGEGAALLQAVFLVDWYNAVGENLFSKAYFPSEAWDGGDSDLPVQILTSGPDSRWGAISQLYSMMIVSAQRHVFIQSPFFIPDAAVAEALVTAAMAGVDVRIMVSARPAGNPMPDWAGRTYLAEVVESGARVFLYQRGYLHAKTVSIDSEVCSIGSTNIDIRSFSINYELNAVIYSRELATELEEDFEQDLAFCTEFGRRVYRELPVTLRFRDSVARLLSPLL